MDLAGTPASKPQVSRCYCRIWASVRSKDRVRPLDASRELTTLPTGVLSPEAEEEEPERKFSSFTAVAPADCQGL